MRLEVLLASGEAIVEGLRVPGRGIRRAGGKWEQWGKCRARRGAQRQRRDGAGCSDGHGAGTAAGAGHGHTAYSGSIGTHRRGGEETDEYDGKPGQQRGGFGQTQWLLSQLGCLLAHQVIGWEAWSTLGYLQQDFCLQNKKVQVETPSCLPHATVPAASTGMLPGEGRSAVNTQNSAVSGEL